LTTLTYSSESSGYATPHLEITDANRIKSLLNFPSNLLGAITDHPLKLTIFKRLQAANKFACVTFNFGPTNAFSNSGERPNKRKSPRTKGGL